MNMGAWLSKVMHALSPSADVLENVRQALRSAQHERTKVTLEVLSGGTPSIMNSSIEQVRDDDLIISQPMVGGHTYPLAFGENVKLNFSTGGIGYSGQTQCQGRVKIPAGTSRKTVPGAPGVQAPGTARSAEQMIFAYRLALPASLRIEDQRSEPRVQLDFIAPIEAQLYLPGTANGPILGRIEDISMVGARVVTSMPVTWMFPGQGMFLKAMLPEPVGLVDELVDIARIQADVPNGRHAVGIRFRKRIPGLAELIRGKKAA